MRWRKAALDLAVTIPQFAMSDLPSRLLYREHYVAAVRQGHPLARGRSMSLDDYPRVRPRPRFTYWWII